MVYKPLESSWTHLKSKGTRTAQKNNWVLYQALFISARHALETFPDRQY